MSEKLIRTIESEWVKNFQSCILISKINDLFYIDRKTAYELFRGTDYIKPKIKYESICAQELIGYSQFYDKENKIESFLWFSNNIMDKKIDDIIEGVLFYLKYIGININKENIDNFLSIEEDFDSKRILLLLSVYLSTYYILKNFTNKYIDDNNILYFKKPFHNCLGDVYLLSHIEAKCNKKYLYELNGFYKIGRQGWRVGYCSNRKKNWRAGYCEFTIKYLTLAISNDQRLDDSYLILAYCYYSINDFINSINCAHKSMESFTFMNPAVHKLISRCAYEMKDYDTAIKYAKEIIKKSGSSGYTEDSFDIIVNSNMNLKIYEEALNYSNISLYEIEYFDQERLNRHITIIEILRKNIIPSEVFGFIVKCIENNKEINKHFIKITTAIFSILSFNNQHELINECLKYLSTTLKDTDLIDRLMEYKSI